MKSKTPNWLPKLSQAMVCLESTISSAAGGPLRLGLLTMGETNSVAVMVGHSKWMPSNLRMRLMPC